ncbi:MAG: OmpA family protein [Deltaproteobacteria bacterium]|nr:OmpA family protein [Deltaproteobacteria bacterium]
MKKIVIALTNIVFVVALAHTTACSSTKAARKPSAEDAARQALVRELNALVAQGPLHFETDTDVLTDESQVLLQRVAAQMHRVPKVRVMIGGHADERGDSAYNLALGERRGMTAQEYLLRLGIPRQRIHIVSLGEEQPVAMGHAEDSWSQNRRDEFTFLLPGENRSVLNIGAIDEDASDLIASTTFVAE